MPKRRLARLIVASAVAVAALGALLAGPHAASADAAAADPLAPPNPPPPDASVSDRDPAPSVAAQGPRGRSGAEGTVYESKRAVAEATVGPFAGPVFGGSLLAGPVPGGSVPGEPIPTDPFGQSLVGFDTRSQVFDTMSGPGRMTVLITNNGNQWCTGFLIGPSTVVTAAHCLHPGGVGQSWYPASAMRVYPAYNAAAVVKAPFGSCGAVTLRATTAWTSSTDDQYDYGAIQLDCAIGNQTGWFGWWWQPKSLDGQIAKVFGYPGDKGAAPWKGKDYVRLSDGRRVFYANDTVGGNSGSPVFRFRGATELGCQGWCVMAVHGYGTYGAWPFSSYNHGPRITQEVSDNFFLWTR